MIVPLSTQVYKWVTANLRTFAPKSSHTQIFLKLATQKGNDILLPKRQKKLGSPTSFWREHAPKIP